MYSAQEVWRKYLQSIGETIEGTSLKCVAVDHFCNDRESADHLFDLVVGGVKRATAGSVWAAEFDGDPRIRENDLSVFTNWDQTKACVVRTTKITVKKFSEVDAADAEREGEGDKSLAYWRQAHTDYFTEECARIGATFSADLPVIFEEFEVVFF